MSSCAGEDVKNAFLQGTGPGQDMEVAAEPEAELAGHCRISKNQGVVLTKVCHGLIDAPRRWWLTDVVALLDPAGLAKLHLGTMQAI